VSRVTKMLGDEFGTASNIKNRVNRQSVLGAITSAQQRLKLYNKVPPNGLVLYTGTIVTDDGKEKKVIVSYFVLLCLGNSVSHINFLFSIGVGDS
jgi:peptide chain release factor subunit 1